MTAREPRADRLLRALRREPVDATPIWFMRQAGRALPEYRRIRRRARLTDIVADADLCAEVTLQPVERLGVDAAIIFADITTPLPGAGIDVEIVEGVGPVIMHPFVGAQDLARLRPFDPAGSVGPLLRAIGEVRRTSPVPVIGFAGAPFTLAAYLVEGRSPRHLTNTKALLHGDRRTWSALMERLVEMDIAYLRAQVEAGAQVVQVFDSWVGQLSPHDYRSGVLPHMRHLFDALAGLGVPTIHFGTDTAGLLPAMAEAGGDAIGLDWRIGLADGWERVGPGRAVQGNLDPHVLRAPWDVIEDACRWVLSQADGRPGHIFNLGHGVLPDTDPDDLRRLVDLVHDLTGDTGPMRGGHVAAVEAAS